MENFDRRRETMIFPVGGMGAEYDCKSVLHVTCLQEACPEGGQIVVHEASQVSGQLQAKVN